jgi:uncharacterized protein with PQ loop repeat
VSELTRTFFVWFAQSLYFFCFIPQVLNNFKRKSGTGLSDFFLLLYLNTYIPMMYYIFLLHLPWAYLVFCPLQMIATLVLIAQRLFYESCVSKKLLVLYLCNITFAFVFLPFLYINPILIANIGGWLMLLIGAVSQLPQVIKVYNTKSVEGFSLLFVLINGFAGFIEVSCAIVLKLPVQTILGSSRVVLMTCIFILQFWMYKYKS